MSAITYTTKAFSLLSLAPRAIQPYLSSSTLPSWSIPSTPSSSQSPWYSNLVPSLDTLAELFPPFLLAVPKHKVTHSRKSMRSANKGLKNKTNFSHCEACGSIKLSHNICPQCYSQISRRWKAEARGDSLTTLRGEVQKGEEVSPSA